MCNDDPTQANLAEADDRELVPECSYCGAEFWDHAVRVTGGFDRNRAATLYLLSDDKGKFLNFGITNRTVEERQREHHSRYTRIVGAVGFADGADALKWESWLVRET